VHVEHAADGLHVWIGANAEWMAVPLRAAAIVAQLRCSEHDPSKTLAAVVVNGRVLYASGSRLASPGEVSR
jgi:hypothetical protein